MPRRHRIPFGYKHARTIHELPPAKRKIVCGNRSKRSTAKKIALRIPPSIGEEMDRRGVPWSFLRYVAHAPPAELEARTNEVLARFPAKP